MPHCKKQRGGQIKAGQSEATVHQKIDKVNPKRGNQHHLALVVFCLAIRDLKDHCKDYGADEKEGPPKVKIRVKDHLYSPLVIVELTTLLVQLVRVHHRLENDENEKVVLLKEDRA
jgi:hypothetical protein